jgi:hypothetical protein
MEEAKIRGKWQKMVIRDLNMSIDMHLERCVCKHMDPLFDPRGIQALITFKEIKA